MENLQKQVLLLLGSLSVVQCFVLTTGPECFQSCYCRQGVIDCRNRNLDNVPNFDVTPEIASALLTNDRVLKVQLARNNIQTIGSQAFRNLTSVNARYYFFYLDNNRISDIDNAAFKSFESKVLQVFLQNNRLVQVPNEITQLLVTNLDLSGNPLTNFDALNNKSIYQMTLGLGSVSTWPQSLSNTTVTQSFQVQGYDANALNGFIRSSSLKTLILAETNLVNLSYLNCEKSLNFSSLSDMFLRNNERLDVDSLFQCNGTLHLQQISIRGSHLQSIPSGIARLGSLVKIDLSNNSIATIGDSDLKGLVNLEQLFISHNPIESISLHAFDNNVHLSTVQFLDTALSTFPLAVTSLQSRPLNLAFTYPMYVQCRCDVLSDLAQINGTKTLNRIYCISQATIDVPTAFDDILSKCP